MSTETTKTKGRPRIAVKIALPKTRFTLKQLYVLNKKVNKTLLVSRVREMIGKEIQIVGKLEPRKKQKGRKAFIFEKVIEKIAA